MIRKSLYLVFLVLTNLTLITCRHKPETEPDPIDCGEATTIDEMMEWVYFKTGTYWVYEEEASGERDTMTVFENEAGESGGFRYFEYTMSSTGDGYNYTYWFNESYCQNCLFDGVCRGYKVTCYKSIPGDWVGDGNTFLFPLKVGNKVGTQCSNGDGPLYAEIISFPESVEQSNDSFEDCAKFNIGCGPQHDWQQINYFLCQNIGIVRKELLVSNEIWNLVEYHIEP